VLLIDRLVHTCLGRKVTLRVHLGHPHHQCLARAACDVKLIPTLANGQIVPGVYVRDFAGSGHVPDTTRFAKFTLPERL
jgi:hypothetical protein